MRLSYIEKNFSDKSRLIIDKANEIIDCTALYSRNNTG